MRWCAHEGFESERLWGLADRLGLREKLPDMRMTSERALIREQTTAAPGIDDNHGFQKSEGRCEDAAEEQCAIVKERRRDARRPGQRRNQDEEVYPPGWATSPMVMG